MRNVRHVSTSTHVMATYQVHVVQTKGEFNSKVMKNVKPVLVEFTAAWCKPCRLLHPRLEAGILKSEIELDLAKEVFAADRGPQLQNPNEVQLHTVGQQTYEVKSVTIPPPPSAKSPRPSKYMDVAMYKELQPARR